MGTTLQEIERLTQSLDLTDLERTRLDRDLAKVRLRLEHREYQRSGFDSNVLNIAERAHELLVEVEFYSSIGQTWAKLFAEVGVQKEKTVVDLCPGHTPKVELGLFYSGFQGHVMVVNKDSSAVANMKKLLALFNPRFTLEAIEGDLFTSTLDAQRFVVANHVLDDLVMDHFCSKQGLKPDEVYLQESALKKLWSDILHDEQASRSEVIPKITAIFERLILPGGVLLLAQYESYVERMLGLKAVTAFNEGILKALGAALEAKGFVRESAAVSRALKSGTHFGPDQCLLLRKQ